MNIEKINNIIDPAIELILNGLEENNISIKKTVLKRFINSSIDKKTSGLNSNSAIVSLMFSGRDRAWAKTNVSDNNIAWFNIKNTLNEEILCSDLNSENFKECSNLLDTFTSSGFAWMRFSSVSKNTIKFQLRTKGSKSEHHIKVHIDTAELFNGNITNLEGVPHKLGLEPGIFEEIVKKDKSNIKASKEELSSFGIQTLEDFYKNI